MASPSHRNSVSGSNAHLVAPGTQQRRMSLPPPPSPLDLPEPVYGHKRPPSPLRNGFAIDPATGEISDTSSTHPSEDSSSSHQWGQRPESPSPSVGQFAANFAQRVGSLMSNMSTRSPGLPTDEELEAEAEREREQSRREAERILAREAEDRRTVEERVLAMLQANPAAQGPLPPPPTRAQTMPGTPPSPSASQKEANWWTLAKQRLTPTKDPLTPAQQIIQDTKARDKEMEKEKKKKTGKTEKKQRSKEWPSSPDGKLDDPAFIKLGLAAPTARPISAAPSSPSTHAGPMSTPPSLAASPLRGASSEMEGASPSRTTQPMYAHFNAQGALDVPGTLLTITKRFEKLEKWTVSHVRALEERMDDVERWLVEKEREKEDPHAPNGGANGISDRALSDIREEMAELQGRIGELGREMAKIVTAPNNLSSGPSRSPAAIGRAPSTSSSVAVQSISRALTSPPRATPPRAGTTSPPVTTPVPSNRLSRTRLPYPTGDYASPPDSSTLGQGPFSPTNSPPASLTSATRARQMSIAGLPGPEGDAFSASGSPSGFPSAKSPNDTTSPGALPAPNPPAWRPSSASPTPRKRYTAALGEPIMKASRERERSPPDDGPRARAHSHSRSKSRDFGMALLSSSPASFAAALPDADDSDDA
ncbi:hypothetical protein C2E23DRAFT_763498, partial [Lenzites betulinus]